MNVSPVLANGYYCFRAEAHLTNYDNPDPATNTTTECFRVLQLGTSILTDPQTCTTGSPPTCTNVTTDLNLADNTHVFDHAVVTGSSADGFPDGTVSFFICTPGQVVGGVCPSTAGTQVGTAVTTSHVTGETFKTEATSNDFVTANQLGVWCFRASYSSTNPVYTGSDGDGTRECFTVRTTSECNVPARP